MRFIRPMAQLAWALAGKKKKTGAKGIRAGTSCQVAANWRAASLPGRNARAPVLLEKNSHSVALAFVHRTPALFSDTIDTKIVVVSRARLKREEVLKGMNGFVLPASSYWLLF